MTNEEAIARIKNHKIVHKMNELLDNIIAEISDLNCEYIEYDDYCGCDAYIKENDVLAIINKYKAYR